VVERHLYRYNKVIYRRREFELKYMQPISKYVGNRRYTAGTCDDELVDDSYLKQNLGNTKKIIIQLYVTIIYLLQ